MDKSEKRLRQALSKTGGIVDSFMGFPQEIYGKKFSTGKWKSIGAVCGKAGNEMTLRVMK